MTHFRTSLALVACILLATTIHAQRYAVGDIVENFTLTDRATNQEVSLHDLEGKVIFLEWFAHWCPFCAAAAEQVESGIVSYYKNQGGNANGVPVIHVAINLQGNAETQTQNFVTRFNIETVLNDFGGNLADRFQPGGQPIFAVINGLDRSTSHDQWELIYSHLGYGNTNHPITTFREAIDTVEAAPQIDPPVISQDPSPLRIGSGQSIELSTTATGDSLSYAWQKDGSPLPSQTSTTLTINSASLGDSGEYSVIVSNDGGQVTSATAQVEVVTSLTDYTASFGLSNDDLLPGADPDHDGYANALEYLAQSNPNDKSDTPNATLEFITENNVPALRIQFTSSSDTIGYDLSAHFWSTPAEAGSTSIEIALGQTSDLVQPIPSEADTYLGRLQASPTSP